MLRVSTGLLIAFAIYAPALAAQESKSDPKPPFITTSIYVAVLSRHDVARVAGGIELAAVRGPVRPAVALYAGKGAGAVELSLLAGSSLLRTTDLIGGVGVSAYNIETYKVLARFGLYSRISKDFAFTAEARAYAAPLRPAALLGIAIRPPR